MKTRWLSAAIALAVSVGTAKAEPVPDQARGAPEQQLDVESAPVTLDGRTVFTVVGVKLVPAAGRASIVSNRIAALAEDRTFDPRTLDMAEVELGTSIRGRGTNVVVVTDRDAAAQGLSRGAVASLFADRIRATIDRYREERTTRSLARAAGIAAAWIAALLIFTWLIARLARRLGAAAERGFDARANHLSVQGLPLVNVERTRATMRGGIRAARIAAHLIVAVACVVNVLDLFPWTRAAATVVIPLLLHPLAVVWDGFVRNLPNVLFLVVLWLVIRFVLRLVRTFFGAVETGTVRLSGFEKEWATPTFRIVRLVLVAFALVIAYPYIPGSESGAFKGISIFAGVMFSLGSSSIIANVVAGYTMTYRRAFRVGDRVRIGDVVGDVQEVKVLVTRVRTLKNEEVVIPNSTILNGAVVNYSSLAGKDGLILHVRVGIGYETPWRQVEAILLEAAAQTPGIERSPAPFVLYQGLGDFCVTYEINGYTRDACAMMATLAALQRNVLDVFNEYGIQIMTPAYVSDPPVPKVVPRDQWYAAPATPAAASSAAATTAAGTATPEPPGTDPLTRAAG